MGMELGAKLKQKDNTRYRNLILSSLKIFKRDRFKKSIGRHLGDGITADVYELQDPLKYDGIDCKSVAKVFKSSTPIKYFTQEIKMNKAVNDVLKENGQQINAPKLFDISLIDQNPALIFEYIQGQTIMYELLNNNITAEDAAYKLAHVHSSIHNNIVPENQIPNFPSQIDSYQKKIEKARGFNRTFQDAALKFLHSLPSNNLCHGDLHPGNIINSEGIPVVIDFGQAMVGSGLLEAAEFMNKLDNNAEFGYSEIPPKIFKTLYRQFAENYISFSKYNLSNNDLLKARFIVIASHFDGPLSYELRDHYAELADAILTRL